MKTHTNEFKEKIKLHGRELESKLTYTLNNETIELGNEDLNSITPHYEGNILKSVMKQLDIDSNVDIPIGTEINYQFGLKVHEYYDGDFNIEGETTQEGTPTPTSPKEIINKTGTITEIINNEPYTFNIGSIELCKIGDYEDSIYYQSSSNNLFDQDTFIPNMINNATYKQYNNGILTMTNSSTDTYMPTIYNNANYKEGINIDVEPNTNYTFSFNVDQPLSTMKNCVMGLNNNNQYSYITNLSQVNVISFNTGNYTKIAIRLGSTASVGTVTHFSNFQLEKGSQTPYEPYEQGWFIKKNIGKVVLTGNDITAINTNQTNTTRAKTDQHFINALTSEQFYNNYFPNISNWGTDVVGLYFSSINGDIWFRAEKSLIGTTLDSVKAWVNSNNVIVYYILNTPTYTKITDANLISQFNKVGQPYEYLNYGNYIVFSSKKKEDTNSYEIVAYDKMLNSMVDYSNIGITYPITIRSYINAIATYMGLTFKNANETFANYNRQIQSELYLSWNEEEQKWDSLNYTFRDVLDELAQVTASTICINNANQLEIRYITSTNDTIDEEYLKDVNVNFEEKYGPVNSIVLSRSANSDVVYLQDSQSIAQYGLCEIKISDNQIMNWNDRSDYLPDILSRLGGLEYQLNDYTSTGIMYYDLCDRYNVKVGEKYYSCIMFNDDAYITQGLYENIHTERPEQSETDYSKADKTDRRINQTYLIVDKQNQTIQSVVSNVSEQNSKISAITQTVDEINSKISDIADLTISGETSYAEVELDNINQSEPIMIKVRPTSVSISYLYPSDNLYPSDDLYMERRTIRFYNENDDTSIYYEIPDDLLLYDSETYDEFYLDYESQTCQITKKCKYNADGSVGLLDNEVVNTYPYPSIPLDDGDYTISLYGYNYGYLFVRLMAQNIYTTQFYTKAETNSIINQTASSIDLSVDTKLSNYSTTQQMNSAITLKANEITSSVSETYSTKSETNQVQSQLSSKITQNATSITSEVTRATNSENTLSSRISQTANSIDLSVNDNGTSAGINIKLKNENGSQIDSKTANITMSGLVKFTDLSGNGTTTIDGSNIKTGTISSNRLSSNVITTSNLSAQTISANQISGGTISGASFKVTGSNAITVYGPDNYKDAELNRYGLYVYNNRGQYAGKTTSANVTSVGITYRGIAMVSENGNKAVVVTNLGTQVTGDLHVTGNITHGSLKEIKKNIKIYNEDVLEKIMNSDIYSFKYKQQTNDKKHLGFIIGDEFRTPKELIDKDGIDIYGMCSMLWKGMQEQQKQIEELKKEMEELKNAKD